MKSPPTPARAAQRCFEILAIMHGVYRFLEGGTIIALCEALGQDEPMPDCPTHLVMLEHNRCTICGARHEKSSTVFETTAIENMGWQCCPRCMWRASYARSRALRRRCNLLVPQQYMFDCATLKQWSAPIQFYRHRIQAMQRGALTLACGRYGVYLPDRAETVLYCTFGENNLYSRGVSIANLARHNPAVAREKLGALARALRQDVDWDPRTARRWCARFKKEYDQGIAFLVAEPMLLSALNADAVNVINTMLCSFKL